MEVLIKRVYDAPSADDGLRVLVDRLWPRGLKKEAAAIDVWARELAPSTELRKWFNHDEERLQEFAERYRQELDDAGCAFRMRAELASVRVTLLYAARDQHCNHALVLQEWLNA